MPPRRQRVTRQNPEGNPEANPEGFLTEERAAELFAKSLNDVLPALVTQIAQAIHGVTPPKCGIEGVNHIRKQITHYNKRSLE